jgi:hypothetical protein
MDITGIAAAATDMAQANTSNNVQMAVLKKSLDIARQGAMQLIDAVPPPPSPPHLGNRVDTFA